MINQQIISTLPALIAHLQQVPAKAAQQMDGPQAEVVKKTLRHAESIAPYRTGALAESLHPVVQPARVSANQVVLTTSIEPEPEIFYSIFLVRRGGRLDWVTRTVEERPDLAQRGADLEAAALATLIGGS